MQMVLLDASDRAGQCGGLLGSVVVRLGRHSLQQIQTLAGCRVRPVCPKVGELDQIVVAGLVLPLCCDGSTAMHIHVVVHDPAASVSFAALLLQ